MAGDDVARRAVERAGTAIGEAIGSATSLVDLEIVAIGGGFSPLIATTLVAWSDGASWAVALYVLVVSIVAAVCTYLLVETVRSDMLEDPQAKRGSVTGSEDTAAT